MKHDFDLMVGINNTFKPLFIKNYSMLEDNLIVVDNVSDFSNDLALLNKDHSKDKVNLLVFLNNRVMLIDGRITSYKDNFIITFDPNSHVFIKEHKHNKRSYFSRFNDVEIIRNGIITNLVFKNRLEDLNIKLVETEKVYHNAIKPNVQQTTV